MRIRKSVLRSQPLAELQRSQEPPQVQAMLFRKALPLGPIEKVTLSDDLFYWAQQDLNLRPTDYESVALTN